VVVVYWSDEIEWRAEIHKIEIIFIWQAVKHVVV
jgi:hypothetical protein